MAYIVGTDRNQIRMITTSLDGFKNDYVYQTLDKSAPEYVRNLWMTSAVLKNGARCDIFLDGYMVENFEKYISTINHQYFIDQIKIRKKLNLL